MDGATAGQPRRRQLFAPEMVPEFLMTETANIRRYVTRESSRTARISVDAHGKPALRSKPQIAAHSETSKPKQPIAATDISEGAK
jgi:hypothetical protein